MPTGGEPGVGIDNREGRFICSYPVPVQIRDSKVDKELVSALT